jgi:hypothetical protein
MRNIFLSLIFLSVIFSQDINECPCCTDIHQQFRFWVGNWNVFDTTGNKIGTNNIILDQDKCLMIENWKSETSPFSGTSYSFYDNYNNLWNQIWVDNQGSNLMLTGIYQNNKMTLRSQLLENENGLKYYHQISWTPNLDGTVTQRWDVFDNSDKLLNTAFFGIYKKVEKLNKIKN